MRPRGRVTAGGWLARRCCGGEDAAAAEMPARRSATVAKMPRGGSIPRPPRASSAVMTAPLARLLHIRLMMMRGRDRDDSDELEGHSTVVNAAVAQWQRWHHYSGYPAAGPPSRCDAAVGTGPPTCHIH